MGEPTSTKKFTWGKVVGRAENLVRHTENLVTLVAAIVGIATVVFAFTRLPIEGTWTLKTRTEPMELTYTVTFTKVDETHVTGKGQRLGEKLAGGKYTPCNGNRCTPFDINGTLDMDGDSLDACFTEVGPKTTCLKLEKKTSSWAGTFKSEAATPSGTAILAGKASLSPF